ncbi:hypothetical protein [Gimesia algae]|uniref:Uncharacterized protein n=1 Tax=Gimesia algae TaxID=2527971 RepID=A0A517V7J8_9PLAN|nr:hypothetical protein [Gimesia algae]QDT88974.1 hypothetical protein Pan161_05930 [Gimesia algae]
MSENKRSFLKDFVYGFILLLPMLYVLSIGPVSGYLHTPSGLRADVSPEAIARLKSFYAPVNWAVNSNDSLMIIAGKYAQFWHRIL